MEGLLMAEKTGIEWTDHTFNIAWGCFKVSPGCAKCYADTLSTRFGFDVWGPPNTTGRRTFGDKHWREPLRWNAAAEKAGVRRRVFCSSMCDVFEDHPTVDAERQKLWPLIRATPHLDWLLLTKRAERIAPNLPPDWGDGYRNVWLGVSVESQAYVGRMWELLRVPAAVHFVSVEPLLEPLTLGLHVALGQCLTMGTRKAWPDWVIVGGESGDGHREMPMHGFESVVKEAKLGGAAVFVKQDSGPRSGMRGRIRDEYWSLKEWPR